jgi:hypothetical protein
MEISWDIYLLLLFSLAAGYVMGIGSRFVIKAAMKDYIESKMNALNSITASYTQKTQIECDKIIEQAQQEAIKIYRTALESQSPDPFPVEGTDLN